MSHTLGWGLWVCGVVGMMVFPGGSRHAESDFDVRFTPPMQIRTQPMSRCVTLARKRLSSGTSPGPPLCAALFTTRVGPNPASGLYGLRSHYALSAS